MPARYGLHDSCKPRKALSLKSKVLINGENQYGSCRPGETTRAGNLWMSIGRRFFGPLANSLEHLAFHDEMDRFEDDLVEQTVPEAGISSIPGGRFLG